MARSKLKYYATVWSPYFRKYTPIKRLQKVQVSSTEKILELKKAELWNTL